MAKKYNNPWTDDELKIAVDYYLYLLRFQENGTDVDRKPVNSYILENLLINRNEAALRYRMRNISFVFEQISWPTLSYYSPAPQVGANVIIRIKEILFDIPEEFVASIHRVSIHDKGHSLPPNHSESNSDLILSIEELQENLEEFSFKHIQKGGNYSQEEIDDNKQIQSEFDVIQQQLSSFLNNVKNGEDDSKEKKKTSEFLLMFGHKLWVWSLQRFTKFVDAVSVTVAPIFVADALNLLPSLDKILKLLGM